MAKVEAAVALVLIVVILASAPSAYCQNVTVTLTAEPQECVLKLIGQGEYPPGGEVTVEVKVKPECRFVKWRVVRGLGIKEVAVNPFTFYPQEDFEAKAILEPLYQKPSGEIVERVVVRTQANVTGLQLPEPLIAKKGEQVLVLLPSEQVVEERKYVFLYAEDTLGNRYYGPEISLVANQSLTVISYYATFKYFLNEYYPLNSFRKVQIPPVCESEGVCLYPAGLRIANKTFSIDSEVPAQLLNLVEPIYEKRVKMTILVAGLDQPIELNVLGKPTVLNSSKELWIKAGSQASLEVPKSFKAYELVEAKPLPVIGNSLVIDKVDQPLSVTLYYRKSEVAFLLDIPLLGEALFHLTRTTEGLLGFKGLPALIFAVSAFIAAPSGAAATILITVRRRARRRLLRAIAAEKGLELMVESTSNPTRSGKAIIEEALQIRGPLNISRELVRVIEEHFGSQTAAPNPTVTENEKPLISIEGGALQKSAESAFQKAVRGLISELDAQLLLHLKLDEERYNLLGAAASGGLKIAGDAGYFGFENQAVKLVELLATPSIPFFALICEDEELAKRVLSKAAEEVGVRITYIDEFAEASPKLIAQKMSRIAAQRRAAAVALSGLTRSVEEAVVRSIPLLEVKTVLITKSAWVKPRVVLGALSPEHYIRITIVLLAEKGLIGYVGWEALERLGRLSNACRGIKTVERFIEVLQEYRDAKKALNEVMVEELSTVFRPEELRLLLLTRSIEDLRDAYMSLVRQLSPGSDPVHEWSNFYERLKRMGVVELENQ